ncbi:unnamed protein product [Didymodactylos carnosus]|uniref:Uncharacterized protein n=1 Tax=Didymodactylos carnosus TaxID=1234261 RepID=A0A816BNX7_9BILA|nr:unnamed protein product [Didymodactylos carnosus]CAF4499195.1 unnamed protein product [Didymodactylos carnosus]
MHVHEILHYTTIFDPSDPSGKVTLCVTVYTNSLISVYNRVNVLVHYFIPFISQVISDTILIIQTAHSRQRTTGGQQTFIDLFKKQFKIQREHYVTPIIIVLSSVPQAILSFTYACTELKQTWQRYILLSTYFLSYVPQILGFILYVLPSSAYKTEFQQTFIERSFKVILQGQKIKIFHPEFDVKRQSSVLQYLCQQLQMDKIKASNVIDQIGDINQSSGYDDRVEESVNNFGTVVSDVDGTGSEEDEPSLKIGL